MQLSRAGLPRVERLVGNLVDGVVPAEFAVQRPESGRLRTVGLRRVQALPRRCSRIRPRVAGFARDLPLLPCAANRYVQLRA